MDRGTWRHTLRPRGTLIDKGSEALLIVTSAHEKSLNFSFHAAWTAYSSILKMETVRSYEKPINFYQTIWSHHGHRHDNLKFHTLSECCNIVIQTRIVTPMPTFMLSALQWFRVQQAPKRLLPAWQAKSQVEQRSPHAVISNLFCSNLLFSWLQASLFCWNPFSSTAKHFNCSSYKFGVYGYFDTSIVSFCYTAEILHLLFLKNKYHNKLTEEKFQAALRLAIKIVQRTCYHFESLWKLRSRFPSGLLSAVVNNKLHYRFCFACKEIYVSHYVPK
jgi:hypothetical protein